MRFCINKYKSYIQEFSVYGISQLLVTLIPIIIMPLLTRSISQDDFANYSIYKSLLVISTPFIGMAFSTYLLKYYYIDLKDSFMPFFTLVITTSLIATILLLIILYIFNDIVLSFLKFDDFYIILFAIINTFLLSLYTMILTFCRAEGDQISFLKLNFIVFILTIIPIITFYFSDLLSLKYILLVNSFSLSIAVIYGFIKFLNFKNIVFNNVLLFKILRFCFPLIIYSVLTQIFVQSDKFIINIYLSKIDLALYYAVFQVCFGLAAFGNILDLTWSPYVFRIMAKETKIPYHLFKSFLLISILILLISVVYFFLMPFLQWILLPENYHLEWRFYIWFVMAISCKILWTTINPFLIAFNKNSYFIYITLTSASISLLLNIYLIKFGIIYAAIVFFITWVIQLTLLIIFVYYANKNQSTLQFNS